MIHKVWRDCAFMAADSQVTLENGALRTRWLLGPEGLALQSLENRTTGFCWQSPDRTALALSCMQPPPAAPQWEAAVERDILFADRWRVCCTWLLPGQTVRRCFLLYPQSPFLTLWTEWEAPPDTFSESAAQPTGIEQEGRREAGRVRCLPGDVMAALPLPAGHLRWACTRLVDQTDVHDTLSFDIGAPVYPAEQVLARGCFFTVTDGGAGETLFAARHAPVTPAPEAQFRLAEGCLCVLQNGCADPLPAAGVGCACVVGAVSAAGLWPAYRGFYRLGWQAPWQKEALLLANTWGDRSRDGRVCEAFLLQELACAARLGLDAVQIDDGWQAGTTVNSTQPRGGVWEGYYETDPNFWRPHPVRFPHGLAPVAREAARLRIQLGLWFSPDSSRDFAHWRQDADTLLHLWQTEGTSLFKLDGVKLRTPAARQNYLRFLDAVTRESGGQIQLQQDITAEQRLGYLAAREYGTLFVENRYTDFGNYYPHRTLRNLWTLAHYLPAQRLLFEVLNPARNAARYGADPLAPGQYPIDYLFACTLAAQPLFWMELSGLRVEDVQRLQPVLALYKRHRAALWTCDVQPIGQEPDGHSFPGFLFRAPGGGGYLLVFREAAPQGAHLFCEVPAGAALRLLCANAPVSHSFIRGGLRVHFAQPRTYAWFQWREKAGG